MEEARARQPEIVLGESLDRLSVEDLERRIERLRSEISRVEAAIAGRKASHAAAESVFRR